MAPRDRLTALQLYGVAPADGVSSHVGGVATQVVAFRDLGAVVAPVAYARPAADADALEAHRRVIDALFANGTVLPAPAGVVFRSRDLLTRWLELHYITLSDALAYVEGRVVARVHVGPPPGEPRHSHGHGENGTSDAAPAAPESELVTRAAESFRILRRHAVASLTLKLDPPAEAREAAEPEVVASFLLERERWTLFGDIVREEAKRAAPLIYRLTGPWPPYDFVSMQFGA